MSDTYSHGHHESVLRSHTWRTVENSAAYLLPHLRPGQRLLDVGCGPGTITADLAGRIAPGEVLGVDAGTDVIAKAQATFDPATHPNLRFATGDGYHLDHPDQAFDVVHAHQVLQHLTDPVAALTEWRRVLRPGGVLAARDSDYAAFVWSPDDPVLDRWLDLYHELTRHNRAEANAGRYLLGWARRAGFHDVTYSTSTWTFADPESRAWWGDLWADRATKSDFANQCLDYGLSTTDELETISHAFRRWATEPDSTFVILHGEIIARSTP